MKSQQLLVVLVMMLVSDARADWPMARHDVARTSTGDGASTIREPAATFRYYLGGSLGREAYVAYDIEADGAKEVLFVMGGALRAKTPDDAVRWETDALDLFRLDGVHDLDGDGSPEIVASALAGRVYVFRPSDGAVQWVLPAEVIGRVGAVRVADLDRDGILDLYLADSACGATASLGDVGVAYSFAEGLSAPSELFRLERGQRDYVCGQNDTIADVDGDGQLEVVVQGLRHLYLFSGADGSLESTSDDIGPLPYGLARTLLGDIDGDGRPELVGFTNNSYDASINSRRVFAMDFDAEAGRLVRR